MLRRALGSAWAVTWRFLLVMMIWGTAISPFFVLVVPQLQASALDALPITWMLEECLVAAFATGAVLLVNRVVDRQPVAALGLAPAHAPGFFGRGVVIGAGIIFAAVGALMAAGVGRRLPVVQVPAMTLVIAAIATLVNAFTQEILFQGYLLPSVLRRGTPLVALLASASVFVLVHGPAAILAPIPGLNLFLAGILLGAARLASNTLWFPLGIHFGWNFVEGPLLGLLVSGHELTGWKVLELSGPSYLSGGTYGPEGSITATVMTIAGIAIVWRRGIARPAPTALEASVGAVESDA